VSVRLYAGAATQKVTRGTRAAGMHGVRERIERWRLIREPSVDETGRNATLCSIIGNPAGARKLGFDVSFGPTAPARNSVATRS
jgi:hypothetical protein